MLLTASSLYTTNPILHDFYLSTVGLVIFGWEQITRALKICDFFVAFAKLRKKNISFDISVCLSVRPSVHPSVSSHATTRFPLDWF